jgi:mannose-6-phosphate isomerase
MFFPLQAPIRHYAWGSPDVISRFRGLELTGQPEAEQWFGDHPEARTIIEVSGEPQDFHQWLSEAGTDFPLLVKLLAAAKPLSIQVHPGQEQAQVGFADELARGVVDEHRTYRDSSAKPELLIALSHRFRALVGFVERAKVERRLKIWRSLGLDAPACDVLSAKLSLPLAESVSWLVGGGTEVHECLTAVQHWADGARGSGDATGRDGDDLALVQELISLHPGDPGVLLALLMHHVDLERGEAVFVDAGVPHAYLAGFGLEVMLPSDNVVRAGLTNKRRDTTEFLKLVDTTAHLHPPVLSAQSSGSSHRYQGFPANFAVTHITELGRVSLDGQPAVIIVEGGSGTLAGKLSSKTVSAGEVIFTTPEEVELTTQGVSSVWVVHPTGPVG